MKKISRVIKTKNGKHVYTFKEEHGYDPVYSIIGCINGVDIEFEY